MKTLAGTCQSKSSSFHEVERKKEQQHVHPRMIEKVITKAVANLEGREGIAFTTWQTCGATREQSHVALTQQRWHWQAMTITAVLKIGIKVIGLESKLSLSERLVPKAKG